MSANPNPADGLRTVDRQLLEAMREIQAAGADSVGVGVLTERLGVTATAVRQRIDRLLEAGLIDREKEVHGRGRPTYQYRLTVNGHRCSGANPTDIAEALWREILAIPDQQTRRQLLAGVAARMGRQLAAEMPGDDDQSMAERLERLSQLMAARHFSAEVKQAGELPVLDICACPYPLMTDSSDQRAMCHLEEQMISEALGQRVQLSSCFLDGDSHCQFTPAVETHS